METLYIRPRFKRLHGFPMKLENFYFIGWPAGRGGKIGKNQKKSGMVNVFSKQVGRQARWSG
jgi:hypothetical protein